MSKKINTCVIGIGSNIEPERNISAAMKIVGSEHELIVVSNLIRTTPIGIKNQPDFLNGVAKVNTEFSKIEFEKYLKRVEDKLGRDRFLPKFGPRTIDLDIVVWNGEIVDKDYYTRDFLQKLVEKVLK
jgi:2-amino-4-hydroxy-6-hydroxymethyldihydropteridine diphosphokinase